MVWGVVAGKAYRRRRDLMNPVWQGFSQNLGISLEVRRGRKSHISNLKKNVNSKRFLCCPQRNNKMYQSMTEIMGF